MRYAKLIITFFLPVVALISVSGCAHNTVAATGPQSPTAEQESKIVKTSTIDEPLVTANPEVGGVAPSAAVPAADPVEAEKLTDEKILKITHEANSAEIAQAQLMARRTKDAGVRDYAKMMVRMHKDADMRGDKVAQAEGIQPTDSATSDKLRTDAQQTYKMISESPASTMDMTYVTAQIEEHSAVLKIIDEELLPGATDANVKALVQQIRPVVARHLEQALTLQSRLKDK